MPTSSSNNWPSISQEQVDAYREMQRAMEVQRQRATARQRPNQLSYRYGLTMNPMTSRWTSGNTVSVLGVDNEPPEPDDDDDSSYNVWGWSKEGLTDFKTKELESTEHFFKTGFLQDDTGLHIEIDERNRLLISGQNYGRGTIIAVVDDRKVIVSNKRGKHLTPLLKELAVREGKEFASQNGFRPYGQCKSVMFWKWSILEEVDDTALVSVTQLATPNAERDRAVAEFEGLFSTSDEEDEDSCDCC